MQYFKATVKSTKTVSEQEDFTASSKGKTKKAKVEKRKDVYIYLSDTYLSAQTFLSSYLELIGEQDVDISKVDIAKFTLTDVVESGEDTLLFFIVKTSTAFENEKGKVKYIKEKFLIDANTPEEAIKQLHNHFKGTLADYTITNTDEIKLTEYLTQD